MPSTTGVLTGEPMLPRLCRVAGSRQEAPGVVTITLESSMVFRPGQFNMLWAPGIGEAAISIAGGGGAEALVHTIREVGATTKALCRLEPGDQLGVRGPYGTGWEVEDGRGDDLVIVAGGLGIAPLRPALWSAVRERADYRRVFLVAGARSPEQLLFSREWDRLRTLGVQVEATVDQAVPGWGGQVGLVTELLRRADFDPSRTLALVCGPEVMMRFTARALVDRGLAPDRIRLSMERNMKCGIASCGHCQLGPTFICREGPVLSYERLAPLLAIKQL